jgi:CheY-like chemotaxis protein
MGGVEAAARLKEFDPDLKLIVSSGYSDAPVMPDFRAYGFDAVIPKP